MLTIREFTANDKTDLIYLHNEHQNVEKSFEDDRLSANDVSKKYIDNSIDKVIDKTGKIYVADIDNKIIGFVAI